MKIFTALAAIGLLTLAACTTNASAESPSVINATCPMMGDEVDAEGEVAEWNGETIGFCCEGCKPKFEALSPEEQAAKLAEQGVQVDS